MSKKILIVDDSRTIRQQVSFTLSKGGFTVVEAVDGQDGIAKLGDNVDIAMIIRCEFRFNPAGDSDLIPATIPI